MFLFTFPNDATASRFRRRRYQRRIERQERQRSIVEASDLVPFLDPLELWANDPLLVSDAA